MLESEDEGPRNIIDCDLYEEDHTAYETPFENSIQPGKTPLKNSFSSQLPPPHGVCQVDMELEEVGRSPPSRKTLFHRFRPLLCWIPERCDQYKMILLIIALLSILFFIAFTALFTSHYYSHSNFTPKNEDTFYFGDHFHKQQFTSNPELLYPGVWNITFDIDHPAGNLAIHSIVFYLINSKGEIPIEQVAIRSLTLEIGNSLVGCSTAGNQILFQLPPPAAIHSPENANWIFSAELANLLGVVNQSYVDVQLRYNVFYSKFTNITDKVAFAVLGGYPLPTTHILGTGTSLSTSVLIKEYTWSLSNLSRIYETNLIAAVGVINSTLSVVENAPGSLSIISSSSVHYSPSHFITYTDISYPLFSLPPSSKIRTTTYYYNSVDIPSFYCSFALYYSTRSFT